ncbi:hypothetical protein H5410_025148 [Solanum commersonii]|uniref:Uncharacterized protein n=1 Tax=Solanum commersonii TaxID=4109 RepID=A0A9J5YV35_SOLCO|nr:hypothetical protein H5410_025148 [Solanum commersonii]
MCDCQTSQDCHDLKCGGELGTCVGGSCVCLAQFNTNHEEGRMEACTNTCQSREDCSDFIKCDRGLPTCASGSCVCL